MRIPTSSLRQKPTHPYNFLYAARDITPSISGKIKGIVIKPRIHCIKNLDFPHHTGFLIPPTNSILSKIILSGLIMLIIANLSIYPFESTTRTKYKMKNKEMKTNQQDHTSKITRKSQGLHEASLKSFKRFYEEIKSLHKVS